MCVPTAWYSSNLCNKLLYLFDKLLSLFQLFLYKKNIRILVSNTFVGNVFIYQLHHRASR